MHKNANNIRKNMDKSKKSSNFAARNGKICKQ